MGSPRNQGYANGCQYLRKSLSELFPLLKSDKYAKMQMEMMRTEAMLMDALLMDAMLLKAMLMDAMLKEAMLTEAMLTEAMLMQAKRRLDDGTGASTVSEEKEVLTD